MSGAGPQDLDPDLRGLAASLEADPSWAGLVALLDRCAELGERGAMGEAERGLVLTLMADATWKPAARFELGLAAGPGPGIAHALELLPDLDVSLERARRAQRSVLIWCDDESAADLWAALSARASWIERRVLLNALDGERAAGLVPALSRLGADTDPVTRAAIVDAMARIGHVSAQPFLCASLGAGDEAVAARAARALAALGTRGALEPLLAYASTREGVDDARAAIAAIEARYPADDLAAAGSLTEAAASSTAGAISVASGAAAGDVALYERAALAIQGGVEEARALEASGSHWRALAAPPRRLPGGVLMQAVVLHDARTVCAWIALALFFTSWLVGPSSVSGAAAVSSWFACVALVCAGLSREDVAAELDMWREGSATFAGVTGRAASPQPGPRGQDLTLHRYQLTYMDERGVTWSTWRSATAPVAALEADAPLATLCVGERSMLRAELSGVHVREDGRLGVAAPRALASTLLPLVALALALSAAWRWFGLLAG